MRFVESLYYLGASAKKYYSLKRQRRLPQRVISIGNITTGGTGKTPAAIAVAQEAVLRGFSPVILTRGYRGRAVGPCFVSRGEGPLLNAEEAGDEAILMSEKLPGVPVVKGADRYEAAIFALKQLSAEGKALNDVVFILDDGFQHWRLYRDKDLVLIDSGNPFGNRALLPFGSLREKISSVGRADIIVLAKTRGPADRESPEIQGLIQELRMYGPESEIYLAKHDLVSCRPLSDQKNDISLIAGKKVYGFCAIGNPASFRETLLSAGAELAGWESFRDHYQFMREDILNIKAAAGRCAADWIVTTEKDIIRTRKLDLPDNILIIGVSFSVEKGFYDSVFKR